MKSFTCYVTFLKLITDMCCWLLGKEVEEKRGKEEKGGGGEEEMKDTDGKDDQGEKYLEGRRRRWWRFCGSFISYCLWYDSCRNDYNIEMLKQFKPVLIINLSYHITTNK